MTGKGCGMELTHDDAGTTCAVRAGEPFTVRLPENPTTGYRWHPDADAHGVDLTGDAYEGSTRPVGSGGQRLLTFTAREPGTTRLRLTRRRSWEQDPVEEFTVELDVRPG
jgi:inhibitor of cysteine peptidase